MREKELSFFGLIDLVMHSKFTILILTSIFTVIFFAININQKTDYTSNISVSMQEELKLSAELDEIIAELYKINPSTLEQRDQPILIQEYNDRLMELNLFSINKKLNDLILNYKIRNDYVNESLFKFFIKSEKVEDSGSILLLQSFKNNLRDNDIILASLPESKKQLKDFYLTSLKIDQDRITKDLNISLRSPDTPDFQKEFIKKLIFKSQNALQNNLLTVTASNIVNATYALEKMRSDLTTSLQDIVEQHEYFARQTEILYEKSKNNSLTILNENLKIAEKLNTNRNVSELNNKKVILNSNILISNFTGYDGTLFNLEPELIEQEIKNIENRKNTNAYPALDNFDSGFAYLLESRAKDASEKLENIEKLLRDSHQYTVLSSMKKIDKVLSENDFNFVDYNIDLISVKNNNVPLINHLLVGILLGFIISVGYIFIAHSKKVYLEEKVQ